MKRFIINFFLILFGLFILLYNPISCRILTLIYADLHQLDRDKYYRLIRAESSFRPWVVSRTKAIGLGQVNPITAAYIAPEYEQIKPKLFLPQFNLKISIRYMQYLLNKYQNNWSLALAAYNWGETNVDRVIKKHRLQISTEKNYQYLFTDIHETYYYLAKILEN
jgi:soluble lytic murein transglycosylase-like protein